MLFAHDVDERWQARVPAVVYVDGTARIQTVTAHDEPLLIRVIESFLEQTGHFMVLSTSFNTAVCPLVDD